MDYVQTLSGAKGEKMSDRQIYVCENSLLEDGNEDVRCRNTVIKEEERLVIKFTAISGSERTLYKCPYCRGGLYQVFRSLRSLL